MARKIQPQVNQNYGTPQPLSSYKLIPVTYKRAPATTDTGFPLGQLWFDSVGQIEYVLVSVAGGSATWTNVVAAAGQISTLTGNSGGAISPAAGNLTIAASQGANTVGSGNTVTVSGLLFTNAASNTVQLTNNTTNYTNNGAVKVTYTLPVTSVAGSVIQVVGMSAGGWTIAQNAGQSIILNTSTSTPGVGGHADSAAASNVVTLVCTVANTTWTATSIIGSPTVT